MLDETRRLEALYAYQILDTLPEAAFDALVEVAAQVCDMPIALVSLIDRDRQWFKACVGLDVRETPRQVSFCNHTIANPDSLLVVPDAKLDPRFVNNPLVTGSPHIRCYAGAPLVTPTGEVLGSLCVIDTVPRQLQPQQLKTLALLAKQVVNQMELRRQVNALEVAQTQIRNQAELLDVATDAIAVVHFRDAAINLTTPFDYWNQSAEKLLGYSATDVRSRSPLEVLLADQSPTELATILTALQQGAWRGELTLKTPRGAQLTLDSRWTVVCDDHRCPHSLLIVNTDITTQKVMELQMLRSQRLESVGTLASGIAHDLNNVFSPILMAVGLLQETLDVDERTQRWLDILHSSANRGASLVKQVLSFSRGITSEKTLLQPKYIIDEVVQVARETFPKTLRFQMAGDRLWLVEADATQLHQVLMNLLVNARDAMPQGGTIRLEHTNLELTEPQIEHYITIPAGRYVCLSISDQGCGMTEAVLDHIFEPFFTTKAPGKGTGLGLSTTLGIVQNHGGYITVDSTVGQGSCFRVYLAAAIDREELADHSVPKPSQPRGQGELILIVDDEPAIRAMTSAALSRQGYRVQTAHNGVDALLRMSEEAASIILIDMMMPIMDGAKTLSVLERLYPQTKFIAMSGDATGLADREQILSKPFTMSQLLNAVQCALNQAS